MHYALSELKDSEANTGAWNKVHDKTAEENFEVFVKDTGVSSAFYAKFIMFFDGANDHDKVYDVLTYE